MNHTDPKLTRTDAAWLDAHWMPFTGNRELKAHPRILVAAEGAYWSQAMVAVQPRQTDDDEERRFVLHGVPWSAYVALHDALDDQSGLKMTYLRGALELMNPSQSR